MRTDMGETAWRISAYLGFFGLFVFCFSPDEEVRSHGRRGSYVFAVEVLALVLADIIRLQLGGPAVVVFAVWGAAVAGAKITLIIKALQPAGGPHNLVAE